MSDVGFAGFYIQFQRIFEILLEIVEMWPARYKNLAYPCWQAFQYPNYLFHVALMLALIKRIDDDKASLVGLTRLAKGLTKLEKQILRLVLIKSIV